MSDNNNDDISAEYGAPPVLRRGRVMLPMITDDEERNASSRPAMSPSPGNGSDADALRARVQRMLDLRSNGVSPEDALAQTDTRVMNNDDIRNARANASTEITTPGSIGGRRRRRRSSSNTRKRSSTKKRRSNRRKTSKM